MIEEINKLVKHLSMHEGNKYPFSIQMVEDQQGANDPFGTTGYYDPAQRKIFLHVLNRHPKDIMRTLAHEFIHHLQNCRGEFENAPELGENYFQDNPKFRELEKEAYMNGNVLFRDYEEAVKKQRKSQKTDADEMFESLKRRFVK